MFQNSQEQRSSKLETDRNARSTLDPKLVGYRTNKPETRALCYRSFLAEQRLQRRGVALLP